MRTEFKLFGLVIAIGILIPAILFGFDFFLSDSQEVQFHDQYFIFSPIEFGLVTLTPFMFGIFLNRAIQNRFEETWTNIFLCIGIVLSIVLVYEVYEINHNLRTLK